MTRETKVGLLVGLAFIIVIGVLLSDHIQSASQPPRAQLVVAPDAVQRGIQAPGGAEPHAGPMTAPGRIEPATVLSTNDSLNQPAQPTIVNVGPGNGVLANGGVLETQTSPQTNVLLDAQPAGDAARSAGNSIIITDAGASRIGPPTTPTTGVSEAALAGAEVRPIVTGFTRPTTLTPATGSTSTPTLMAAGKSYKALDGDNLWNMTVKHYGKYSKKGADLILSANPSMGADGRKIAAGKTYTIPPFPQTATASTGTPTVTPVSPTPAAKPEKAALTYRTYTVKSGDSLSKIADKQLGGAHTVADLRSLNKDVLKGSDNLKPGMVLKIPTSQVAAVN